jgi:hypothetical protein
MESIEAAERGDGKGGAAESGGGEIAPTIPDAWREAVARSVPTHLVEFVTGKRTRDVEPNAGKRGRPPIYKWELIEAVIDFFLSNQEKESLFHGMKQEPFIEGVRKWCRESYGKAPDRRAIERRIHARARAK